MLCTQNSLCLLYYRQAKARYLELQAKVFPQMCYDVAAQQTLIHRPYTCEQNPETQSFTMYVI